MGIPSEAQFFSREDPSKPDIAFLKNHFYREGRLSEDQAMYILEKGTEILHHEPNVLSVDAPITGTVTSIPPSFYFAIFAPITCLAEYFVWLVCGDIHGQYVRSYSGYNVHLSLPI